MRPVLAVVEISTDPLLLSIAFGVILVVLILLCVVCYLAFAKSKVRSAGKGAWTVEFGGQIPISKENFERLTDITAAAVSRPEITPEIRSSLNALDRSRDVAVTMYRTLMLGVGLAGLAFGLMLLNDATPANMLALPAGIVLLFSCGAVLSGIFPSRRIRGSGARKSEYSDRFKIEVSKAEPVTLRLSEADIRRAAEVVRQGLPLEEAARAAFMDYDRLDIFEQQALLSALDRELDRGSRS